ncbi:glycosyltransferase family 2 protein [Thermodesulfobacteriota bacterium]
MAVKISTITVVLNGAATIRDCIESVQIQTHPPEHIIIDGGSTDGTLDIINEYPQISQIISEPDNGIYDAMNKGIGLATGDVVGILNADDIYADSNILSKVAKAFESESINACYGDLIYVNPTHPDQVDRWWRSGEYRPNRFYWGWMPPHPTFFVQKSVYDRYGYFNPALGSSADYELMLRLLLKYRIRPAYIPEVLIQMRTGGISNVSIKNRLLANRNDRLAWKVNGIKPCPWTLWLKPIRKIPQYFKKP